MEEAAALNEAMGRTLRNWKAMAGSETDEAENTADGFQASFYEFIDAIRAWYQGLDEKPDTLEGLLAHPVVANLAEQMPGPLLLNFETELELIVDHIERIDDAKYD